MDLGLSGKRAAVAAASAGLGLAVAEALAAEGVQVAICGRDRARLDGAAARIGATAIQADVSDPAGAGDFVERASAIFGGLDILVTNSGGPPLGNFETTPWETYEAALRGNLLSAIAMCRAAVPGMKAQNWGRILAITSISARRPQPRVVTTGMSRAGLTAFLKSLSLELAPFGITVNSIQPGQHRTERLDYLYAGKVEELGKHIPVGHLGSAADFGQVGAFLCSRQANYITGSALPVDGGSYPALY